MKLGWIGIGSLALSLSIAGSVAWSAPQGQPQKYTNVVRRIEHHGLKSVTEADVLDQFDGRHISFSVGSQLDPAEIKKAQVAIKELLVVHGHKSAVVTPTETRIPGTDGVRVVFTVDEGP
jgi:outer membrane protein assembly factor BamA